MKIYGKVHNVLKKERIISILVNNRIAYFHMTNKNMKDFKNYLIKKPYVFLNVSDNPTYIGTLKAYNIEYFIKIIDSQLPRSKVYYDINIIKQGVRKLLNGVKNKMFIDLEFSIPTPTCRISEIIQYGIIIEGENDEVLFSASSLVNPLRSRALNKRTLSFLSLTLEDFNNACSYIEFYQLLEECIKKYDVKIFAWGRNDILALEQSFKSNYLQPLDIRNRYINLMQVIKNYYNYRQEMGLFTTYQELTNTSSIPQIHDALEDASIAREIYHIFYKNINEE